MTVGMLAICPLLATVHLAQALEKKFLGTGCDTTFFSQISEDDIIIGLALIVGYH